MVTALEAPVLLPGFAHLQTTFIVILAEPVFRRSEGSPSHQVLRVS
jgi:hypothetical protein